MLELGYIGRRIRHEYLPINLNAVPYMMTMGGQSFAQAYAAVETAMGCATSEAACGAKPARPWRPSRSLSNALAGNRLLHRVRELHGGCREERIQ